MLRKIWRAWIILVMLCFVGMALFLVIGIVVATSGYHPLLGIFALALIVTMMYLMVNGG